MNEFEKTFEKADISLFILPPRSPALNGNVERSNKTFRYEFYCLYERFASEDEHLKKLTEFTKFYNEIRPHKRLRLLPCPTKLYV